MFAKILSAVESNGVLTPCWLFEYYVRDRSRQILYGTLTTHEAVRFAGSPEVSAFFEMCRAIKNTPADEYRWLAGRLFHGKTLRGPAVPDPIERYADRR